MADDIAELPRQAYKGSCHCGKIKYIAQLSLPPSLDPAPPATAGTRIRKCNCSTCHKLGFFHVRLQRAPRDFMLLSPSTPDECGIYRCFKGNIRWCFCTACSAMVFAYWVEDGNPGERVLTEVDGEKREVWKPKENWREGQG